MPCPFKYVPVVIAAIALGTKIIYHFFKHPSGGWISDRLKSKDEASKEEEKKGKTSDKERHVDPGKGASAKPVVEEEEKKKKKTTGQTSLNSSLNLSKKLPRKNTTGK